MKYLTEFLGTFFLVFIIGLSSNPLVIGLGLSILIYLGAKFSGAHYNPAVSISFCLKKTISISFCFLYVVCQIFGDF
ncbi:MAG: aquaporin, partial [Flavobacteriaceae bacterium]